MLAQSILCKRAAEHDFSQTPQLLHKRISEVRTAGHWVLKEAGIWDWCLWIGQCFRLKPSRCRSTCLQEDLGLVNSRALSKRRRVHVPEKGMEHKKSCFFTESHSACSCLKLETQPLFQWIIRAKSFFRASLDSMRVGTIQHVSLAALKTWKGQITVSFFSVLHYKDTNNINRINLMMRLKTC